MGCFYYMISINFCKSRAKQNEKKNNNNEIYSNDKFNHNIFDTRNEFSFNEGCYPIHCGMCMYYMLNVEIMNICTFRYSTILKHSKLEFDNLITRTRFKSILLFYSVISVLLYTAL